jgi:hypothetical protein
VPGGGAERVRQEVSGPAEDLLKRGLRKFADLLAVIATLNLT